MKLGALEAGGTKMVCAIGNENGEILKREVFPAPLTPITPRRSPSFIAKEISFNITSVPKERLISDADKAIIYIYARHSGIPF